MFHLPDDPPESPPFELRLGWFRGWRDLHDKLSRAMPHRPSNS